MSNQNQTYTELLNIVAQAECLNEVIALLFYVDKIGLVNQK